MLHAPLTALVCGGAPLATDRHPNRIITPANSPIFFSFFTWGFGTGAQQLARPLIVYELTGNVFLVTFVIAMNAIPRVFTGPITGYLNDRVGRKPLAMFGAGMRGVTNVGQFFAAGAGEFWLFFALEFVGQVGVSMWNTSANVLISDVTTVSNRGRVLAVRQMSMRLGFVAGPLLAGLVANTISLPAVFLINGASKVIIVLTVLWMVRETKPERAVAAVGDAARAVGESARTAVLRVVRTRSFVALAMTITGFSMTQSTLLQALLPVYAKQELGVGNGSVGLLVSFAAAMAFIVAFPNGILSDRFGRKFSIVPGLLLLASASMLLTVGETFVLVLFAVSIQGSGEGMMMGSTHGYAMDIAPAEHRGSFLGTVMMFQAAGGLIGPMAIGALYHNVSHDAAFAVLAGWLTIAALAMVFLGRETAGSRVAKRLAEMSAISPDGEPDGEKEGST